MTRRDSSVKRLQRVSSSVHVHVARLRIGWIIGEMCLLLVICFLDRSVKECCSMHVLISQLVNTHSVSPTGTFGAVGQR